MRKKQVVLILLSIIVVLLIIFYANYKTRHVDRIVKIKEVWHQEVKKPDQAGSILVMVKNGVDFEEYLKDFGVPNYHYSIDWDKEFVLFTYPFEISTCTYKLCNKRGNHYPLDILYKKSRIPLLHIYKVTGTEFVTWDAMGLNEKIEF